MFYVQKLFSSVIIIILKSYRNRNIEIRSRTIYIDFRVAIGT